MHSALKGISVYPPSKDRTQMNVLEQLDRITVRIVRLKQGKLTSESGTGFYFVFAKNADGSGAIAIVTNNHVLAGADSVRITLHVTDEDGGHRVSTQFAEVDVALDAVVPHPNPRVDLCAILISPTLEKLRKASGKHPAPVSLSLDNVASAKFLDDLLPFESVRMIGYPVGLWDKTNNAPIVRRGAMATNPQTRYEGRPEFLIDIAAFPGSSGSPVVVADAGSYGMRNGALAVGDRFALVGVLWGGPVCKQSGEIVEEPVPLTKTVLLPDLNINIGCVSSASELHILDAAVRTFIADAGRGKLPPHKSFADALGAKR